MLFSAMQAKKSRFKRLSRPFIALALFAALLLGSSTAFAAPVTAAAAAAAAGELSLSTLYPGITVKAGEQVDFALLLANAGTSPLDANLEVTAIPSGWEGSFTGGGHQISRMFVDAQTEEPATATFELQVPEDAQDGRYTVGLRADAGGGVTDTLELVLNVSSAEFSKDTFTSQYPELQGQPTATFNFSVTLTNNSGSDKSYSLAAQPPDGWQVNFKPTGDTNQIASLSVVAGRNQGLTATVTPPASVTAGEYIIPCAAISGDEALQTDLKVIITGTYSMQLSTPNGLLSLDAYADRETQVTLSITNSGSADLQNVTLTSSLPVNWAVRYDVSEIAALPAGTTQEIAAYIKPGPNVISGDYVATLNANAKETTAKTDFRVTVKTSTAWGVIGIVIIVLLAAGLALVFRKFGRR